MPRRTHTYTLIELLVVIVIIMVLASLLAPALQQANRMAKTTVCSNKLKQLGICGTLYADDFDEYVLPSWAAWQPALSASWYDQLMTLRYLAETQRNGPYIEGKMLHCELNPNWYAQTASGATGLNYAINEAFTRDLKNGYVYAYTRLSQVRRPGFKVIFGEPYLEASWGDSRCDYTLFTYANMPGGTGYYHDGRTNATYGDGHVELLSMANMAPPPSWHWWYRYEPTWAW